jgi:hypothetical protein
MNRNINFMLAFITIFVMSCSNQKTTNEPVKEDSGAHVHEDGTVHEAHDKVILDQEEFNLKSDSIATEEHGHNHDSHEGHNH